MFKILKRERNTYISTKTFYAFTYIFFSFFLFQSPANASNHPKILTIYSNASFAREWTGDGHQIKNAFEEKCDCKLNFVALDSGGTLLSRLFLEGKKSKADLVLGIDANLIAQAENSGLFVPYRTKRSNLKLPIEWTNKYFLPYDYGYFAFIYDKNKISKPPKSFHELVYSKDKIKIIMQDPRSSTVGLGMLAWMNSIFGDKTEEAWSLLNNKVLTVTKSWGESYSLFLKGEADMVLSYSSSPAYHMIVEKNFNFQAAEFEEGHYLQVEVIGKLANAPNPELADMFLDFVLSKDFQNVIPVHNFMYPVIEIGEEMPNEYFKLPIPQKVLYLAPELIMKNKGKWVSQWLESTTRN